MSFGAKLDFHNGDRISTKKGGLPLYNGRRLYLKVALSYKPLHAI